MAGDRPPGRRPVPIRRARRASARLGARLRRRPQGVGPLRERRGGGGAGKPRRAVRSRPLRGTGLTVSEIGLSLAAALAQPRLAGDEPALAELVHRALDHGVTLFDTSDAEGSGYAEELLGRLLRGHRREVVFLTKAGYDITGSTLVASLFAGTEAEQRRNR